jgi:hypothetical protein
VAILFANKQIYNEAFDILIKKTTIRYKIPSKSTPGSLGGTTVRGPQRAEKVSFGCPYFYHWNKVVKPMLVE